MLNRITTRRSVLVFALALIAILLPSYGFRSQQPTRKPTVILISLDGFRWDYFDKGPVPALNALAAFEIIEQCGHAANMEQPDRFNALLVDFVGRL